MGYYIQTDSFRNKADWIEENFGATRLNKAPSWAEVPKDKAAICVVDNGLFEAAAFAYNEQELVAFSDNYDDLRPKTWLIMDRKQAEALTGFKQPS